MLANVQRHHRWLTRRHQPGRSSNHKGTLCSVSNQWFHSWFPAWLVWYSHSLLLFQQPPFCYLWARHNLSPVEERTGQWVHDPALHFPIIASAPSAWLPRNIRAKKALSAPHGSWLLNHHAIPHLIHLLNKFLIASPSHFPQAECITLPFLTNLDSAFQRRKQRGWQLLM